MVFGQKMWARATAKKCLHMRMYFYLVSDHFRVEFKSFGDVEFAERGTELTHHFQLGPHVAACACYLFRRKLKYYIRYGYLRKKMMCSVKYFAKRMFFLNFFFFCWIGTAKKLYESRVLLSDLSTQRPNLTGHGLI